MKTGMGAKVVVVLGTRPEIIKMQPIIKEIESRPILELDLIHTGQHYDFNMSDVFLDELDLHINTFLNVKSASQGTQTARIISRSERVFKRDTPNVVLVQGDTNTALGASIAASKLKIPVGHVEAGCRSFDKNMPEELNRVLIADVASMHFAPTKTCVQNLLKEGIPENQIYLTGHPIVDVLSKIKNQIDNDISTIINIEDNRYYLVTLHREENVDNKQILKDLLIGLSLAAEKTPIIFPLHPRTRKSIHRFDYEKYLRNIHVISPVNYLQSLKLIKNARIVLTDSGGIQQEAALLGTPCITLRKNTEWVETIDAGVNFLAGTKEKMLMAIDRINLDYPSFNKKYDSNSEIFGKLGVSSRIVDIIQNLSTL